jgi:hypothetical protein
MLGYHLLILERVGVDWERRRGRSIERGRREFFLSKPRERKCKGK